MFGKRKCDTPPKFDAPLTVGSADAERVALAGLKCPSGEILTAGSIQPPSAAALMKGAEAKDAAWMYRRRLDCSRCKSVSHITVARPAAAEAPHALAVRSKARADVYAMQHAFLPEWFLNMPDAAITILTQRLDAWQAQTMTQIAGVVERSDGNPIPIEKVQLVATPGETPAVLIDFIPPQAPIEAHFGLLVGGPAPRFFLSEKTHLGDDQPLAEMAGLTEWSFANSARSDMRHTAYELLPDTSREAFLDAAFALLKRSFA